MSNDPETKVSFRQLLSFFIPLGISASLITISHLIINSTLARSAHPEIIIASYALPFSILAITERPAILLRQTCSALVRDRVSFRAVSIVSLYIFSSILLMGALISYTPIGKWVFFYLFGVDDDMLGPMIDVYRVLMFVSIFSGLRCLFQGVIIFNMRTKWLTIGMIVRLLVMYLVSLYFIKTNGVTSGQVGAIIFLSGMMVEALMSFLEGRVLLKKFPRKLLSIRLSVQVKFFNFTSPCSTLPLLRSLLARRSIPLWAKRPTFSYLSHRLRSLQV